MAVIEIKCRYCEQEKVVKNGTAPNGLQRFHRQAWRWHFQVESHHNSHKPGTAQRIVDMAFNGSGVRDASRVLGVSKTTVIQRLKILAPIIYNGGGRLPRFWQITIRQQHSLPF